MRLLRYRSALITPTSQGIKGSILLPLKHAYTIIVTFPLLTDLSQCLDKNAYPGFHIHQWYCNFCPKTIEDSSDQMTCFQSSTVQCWYFHAHASLSHLCFAVRKRFLHCIWEKRLISFSWWQRVVSDTLTFAKLRISWNAKSSCFLAHQVRTRSSCLIVFRLHTWVFYWEIKVS